MLRRSFLAPGWPLRLKPAPQASGRPREERGRCAQRHGGRAGSARAPASASIFCKAAAMRSMPRSRPALRLAVTYPRAGNIGGGGFMVIHLADGRARHHHRLSRDRARRDHPRDVSSTRRRCRPGEIARLRARHRRARHGRGACARAREIRLGQVHARRADRARDRARARRHPGRRRRRGFAAARAGAAGALAVIGENLLQARRQRARSGRPLVQRDLADTLAAIARDGPRAFYEGADRREASSPPCAPPAAS